jgi:succinyl-diaminopimelate desuccinylase
MTEFTCISTADREEILSLCCDLVNARSENPPGDCRAPAERIRRYLRSYGIAPSTVARAPEKPNLVATLEGRDKGPHLILNGHLDTVGPGDERDWSVPVFAATRRGGRIHGLGAGNMKGAVSALTAAFARLSQNRDAFRGRVSLALVADETVFGPDGAGYLLEERPDLLGDGVICGEGPGAMALAVAEKGVLWLELSCRVPSGQGMLTVAGASAIARLSRVIAEIDRWNDEQASPPAGLAAVAANAGEHGLRLSANAGTIRGGRFVSQKADQSVAEIDFRVPPGLTIDDIERRVRAACGEAVAVRRIKGWDPNWTAPSDPIVQAVGAAALAVRGRVSPPVVRLPASDASRWRARGVAAVCFGPQPLLASGVDDYVEEQDVIDCAAIYAQAAVAWLNGQAG